MSPIGGEEIIVRDNAGNLYTAIVRIPRDPATGKLAVKITDENVHPSEIAKTRLAWVYERDIVEA